MGYDDSEPLPPTESPDESRDDVDPPDEKEPDYSMGYNPFGNNIVPEPEDDW